MSSRENALRVAVVGSGPAAFYAAGHLLASEDPHVEVDMIERLPTPWGLVRLGVAPDHPKLKAVSRAFEKIAARPGFRFLGNVEVGRDVTHDELMRALRRRGLRGRRADRPAARDPGRGSPGLVGGHRARRLVQRPPRLPGPRVRSLGRARRRHRERERRSRRRADARADARGAGIHRHDRRRDRGDRRFGDRRDRRSRSSRAGAGSVDVDRAPGAGRARRSRRRSSTRPSSSSTRRARPSSQTPRTSSSATSRSSTSSRHASPPGKPRAVRLRFRVSPVAILGEDRVEARRDSPQPARSRTSRGRVRAVADRRARGDPVRDRLPQRRLPRRRARRVCRSTSVRARCRTRRPRSRRGTASRSPVSTARVGSSAARRA